MILTPSQIATIEKTLVLNEVIYEDIKLELTDHIATEIEVVLVEKECSFEEALKIVFEKWSPELIPSTSFWTPNNMKLPRIVLNKYVAESKRQFLVLSIGACLGSFILVFFANKINNQNGIEYIKYTFQFFFGIELLLTLYCKLKIKKFKKVTFYSMVYQKQTSFVVVFIFLLTIGFWSVRLGNENIYRQLISNFFVITYFILPLWNFQLALRHFKFIHKLKNF
jgi:hypothetical protein